MKRPLVSLFVFSFFLSSCSAPITKIAPGTTPTSPSSPDLFSTPWDDRSLFKKGLITADQPVLNELKNASVYHLDFKIADDLYYVTGTEEVRYTNAENVALDRVELRLFPNVLGGKMTISNLNVDDQAVTPEYRLENSLLIVRLAKQLEPGKSILLHMDFAVTVPQSVDRNYGVLAYFEDVLALAHSYPMICVYDDQGWNAEIPSPSGDVTYGDASFYLVKVTAPKDLTLVTTGQKVKSDEAGQLQTLEVASGPARDFYLAASPNYQVVSGTFGETTINSYAPKDSQNGAQMALEVASRAIKDYSVRYAPFPYTEFDIVSTPTQALGIEYPGMIAIASRIYAVDQEYRGVPGRVYMESTVAHEVGHQWFYNLVGDDQLDDPWLDESLAQFATLQYFTDEYGQSGAQGFENSLKANWASINDAKIPIGLPVAKYTPNQYRAIVYGRGPLFFVALRDQMGTQAFDAFLKDYTQTLSWGISTPQELQSLAEKHCSCDLSSLFKEWVYP